MRKSSSRKSSSKFLALSLLSAVLVAAPVIKAYAAGGDEPKPPQREPGFCLLRRQVKTPFSGRPEQLCAILQRKQPISPCR